MYRRRWAPRAAPRPVSRPPAGLKGITGARGGRLGRNRGCLLSMDFAPGTAQAPRACYSGPLQCPPVDGCDQQINPFLMAIAGAPSAPVAGPRDRWERRPGRQTTASSVQREGIILSNFISWHHRRPHRGCSNRRTSFVHGPALNFVYLCEDDSFLGRV